MAKTDYNAQSDDQLVEALGNLKREQFNLRFQAATSQLEKSSRVKEVRRDIARIKTLQAQRTAAAACLYHSCQFRQSAYYPVALREMIALRPRPRRVF